MIIKCPNCLKYFDDQFRTTICPHDTFSANDGWNNFKHYPESWLADHLPVGIDYLDYNKWLNDNKVKL